MSNNEITAQALTNVRWVEDGKLASFKSARGFYVRKGETFLSFNGVRPSVWDRKATAVEIASTIVDDGSLTWLPVA